jgi:hypothetical protein
MFVSPVLYHVLLLLLLLLLLLDPADTHAVPLD